MVLVFPYIYFFKVSDGARAIHGVAMTGDQVIRKVAVMAAHIATCAGYHSISACTRRVAMKAATSAF